MGISEEKLNHQLSVFMQGIPFIELDRPCTINDGIIKIPENQFDSLLELHDQAAFNSRLSKFVPASGAATRMFKQLFAIQNLRENIDKNIDEGLQGTDISRLEELHNINDKIDTSSDAIGFGLAFLNKLHEFSFYDSLKANLQKDNLDINELLESYNYGQIFECLMTGEGLDYASYPKGLIIFHRYSDGNRTPFDEHIEEGCAYTMDRDKLVTIHFTVSVDAQQKFHDHLKTILSIFEKRGIKLEVTFSIQKSSTDTIAVTPENEPFRLSDDSLLFRPGGHGALIENLHDLQGDIIFIKNIDNVIPDKTETVLYKKLLCGKLIEAQMIVFQYLRELDTANITVEEIHAIAIFAKDELSISLPKEWETVPFNDKIKFLFSMLNRPLRVCGVVKNVGEPGGGPFWVLHEDGSASLQIVEASQIDTDCLTQSQMLNSATHFNPVDLVCGVRNYKNELFNLPDYIDQSTGFISLKSKDGRELKALELPGLWNGSMALWNTIFIEVPITTFNPVKTVNDLLRKEHQNYNI